MVSPPLSVKSAWLLPPSGFFPCPVSGMWLLSFVACTEVTRAARSTGVQFSVVAETLFVPVTRELPELVTALPGPATA